MPKARPPGSEPHDDIDIEAEPRTFPVPAGWTTDIYEPLGGRWSGIYRTTDDDPQRAAHVDAVCSRLRGFC